VAAVNPYLRFGLIGICVVLLFYLVVVLARGVAGA
jgi:hypothetical protein